MDMLDYGRCFIIDALRSPSQEPPGRSEVEEFLGDLHALLEGSRSQVEVAWLDDADGSSAAIRGSEGYAVLHQFSGSGRMCLQVFSRRDVLLSDLSRSLAERFAVGRFENHLGHATKALPKDRTRLARALAGDRAYARARLDDRLLTP